MVYRRGPDGAARFLLLRNAQRGEWGLPKGHLEPGESSLQGAQRELREETGLSDLPVDPGFLHSIRYPVGSHLKCVDYFLARADDGEVSLSDEHDACDWLPARGALALLPHAKLRDVLAAAEAHLRGACATVIPPTFR